MGCLSVQGVLPIAAPKGWALVQWCRGSAEDAEAGRCTLHATQSAVVPSRKRSSMLACQVHACRASVDILKSGGYKISALEIERRLLEHPEVAELTVLGVDDVEFGQRIAAVVVSHAWEDDAGALREQQQQQQQQLTGSGAQGGARQLLQLTAPLSPAGWAGAFEVQEELREPDGWPGAAALVSE